MKRYANLLLVLLALYVQPSSAEAEATTGVVFHDQNSNGARDDGEPGIAGVRVSNGNHLPKFYYVHKRAVTSTVSRGR